MFEDSLIESGNRLKTKRLSTSILSFVLQFLLLGILILIPLIYTDALPKTQLMTFLVAPPPPPPPPPQEAPTRASTSESAPPAKRCAAFMFLLLCLPTGTPLESVACGETARPSSS